jgi:surface protein
MGNIFRDSNLSVENLTAIYENWSQLSLKQNVEFGAGTIKYNFSGQAGRDILTNTYNWIITDGGVIGGVTSVPFIIEVDTTKAGISNSEQFEFTGAVGDYDVVAKQGGSVVQTFNDLSNQQTITLPSSGVYVLEITPKATNGFNKIAFNNSGDKLKITDIKNWGTIAWSSFERAFWGCSNMLVTATDVPDLSNVNSMFAMFFGASSVNPDTTNWDVSNVTNMQYMFYNASSANPDTTNWDVSNVTNMLTMFQGASSANPDTTNWDVSSVTDMSSMFFGASSANPNTTNWNVSNVTSMNSMFYSATSANPNTSLWDVSSVTDMFSMFYNSNLSVENLTSIYENWSQLTLQQNLQFGAGTTKYNSSGQAGRDILVNTYNWIITDGGQV